MRAHGNVNVKIHEDNSLVKFGSNVRFTRMGKTKLSEEQIALPYVPR